jgi:hypothetical protein
MKRSAVSRQRNTSALARRGAGNTGVIGLLLLSLLLFNAPDARAQQQIVLTGGATWNTNADCLAKYFQSSFQLREPFCGAVWDIG